MNITCAGAVREMPERATAAECLKAFSAYPAGTMAALVDGVVTELNTPVEGDCAISPITLDNEEGRRIYERSLRFVLLLAL